jgi:hypothetical protein
MLVHITVHQVPELGHEVLGGWRIVIGPHDCVEFRILRKLGYDLANRIGRDADVCVKEEHDLAARSSRPDVPGPRRTKPAACRPHLGPVLRRYFERIISGPIVHYDAFHRYYRRATQARQALLEVACSIVDGDNN